MAKVYSINYNGSEYLFHEVFDCETQSTNIEVYSNGFHIGVMTNETIPDESINNRHILLSMPLNKAKTLLREKNKFILNATHWLKTEVNV